MRTDWYFQRELLQILSCLTFPNELACHVSMATGLRIGDVLALPVEKLRGGNSFSVREQKTGKIRRVTVPEGLRRKCLEQAGSVYVFPGRNGKKPRTRQAVWKDIKRACKAFRIPANLAPHSMRKVFAVEKMRAGGDVRHVRKLLRHSSEAVTFIYAMADELYMRRYGEEEPRHYILEKRAYHRREKDNERESVDRTGGRTGGKDCKGMGRGTRR